jgi:hypothetical protein
MAGDDAGSPPPPPPPPLILRYDWVRVMGFRGWELGFGDFGRMADNETVSSCSKIYVEAYTSLPSLGLDTTVRLPSLVCPEPVRQNVCVACSKCCLHVLSLAPMLRQEKLYSNEITVCSSGSKTNTIS